MSNDEELTLREGEGYIHIRSLFEEELEAMETICGLHPDSFDDGWSEEDRDCVAELHLSVLRNLSQFVAANGFESDHPEAFANLATYAEFMLDTLSLVAKADEGDVVDLIVACLMARDTLNGMVSNSGSQLSVWDGRLKRAKALHNSCIMRPANRN